MNHNVGRQHPGVIAWDGTAGTPRDIRKFNYFGFVFEVTAAIAADAVFNIVYHNADPADDCVPEAASNPVAEIALCDGAAQPADQAQVTIPAGTPVGTVCSGTIPCRPGAFVALEEESGDVANVRAVMVLSGPHI